MSKTVNTVTTWGVLLLISLFVTSITSANGGPFVIKYPNGDPAAKGILARLAPDLKPRREHQLRVVKEDLTITFTNNPMHGGNAPAIPLALVSAAYTIKNPKPHKIEVDFGFPILRGIHIDPFSMLRRPAVDVRMNEKQRIHPQIISNSAIYGIIRQRAREVIENAVAKDTKLAKLVDTCRATGIVRRRVRKTINDAVSDYKTLALTVTKDPLLGKLAASDLNVTDDDHTKARDALAEYLRSQKKWSERDTTLMVEYASLDLGNQSTYPWDRGYIYHGIASEFTNRNIGPLGAIGEQKATQYLAKLSACFDPQIESTYESIFTAWGGDVRERSVDLTTGKVRPREITVNPDELTDKRGDRYALLKNDPTIYARVEYLDPNAKITEVEKASCKAILKNLPVVFTFAPMNLLHYRVQFPANSTNILTVSYKQHAYMDTREPASYQLAYVIHPASLWDNFGPINLEVAVPAGVNFKASVPCKNNGTHAQTLPSEFSLPKKPTKTLFDLYKATLTEKTGELFLAIDTNAWNKTLKRQTDKSQNRQQVMR